MYTSGRHRFGYFSAAFVGPALLLLAVNVFPALQFELAPGSYLLFHNLAEFFSVLVSLSMFGIGWYTYDQSQDRHALFLSIAFLGIGLMDFMHVMANAAMPAFITPNSSNKSTQFWIAVRFFQAAVFLASAYIYPETRSRWLSKSFLLICVLLVSVFVFTGVIFFPELMPATFIPGKGLTSFKKTSEYLIIGLLCGATVAYGLRMKRSGDRLLLYYMTAFVISIFGELSLAVYTRVFDTYNVLGHIYKVAAFYLIYHGVYRATIKAPYLRLSEVSRKLKDQAIERELTQVALRRAHDDLERRVRERTAELAQSNMQLRDEIVAHRKAQEALHKSETLYRTIAENFPEGSVCVFDQQLRILLADGQALAKVGFAREKLNGKHFEEILEPELFACLKPRYLRTLAGEQLQSETQVRGSFFSSTYVPIRNEQGTVIAGMVVSHDITDRIQSEKALRKLNETLEERVAERTVLAEKRSKQLQSLAVELLEAEEGERRRVAQLLHDDLQQILAAARFQLQAVCEYQPSNPMLSNVEQMLDESIMKARRLSHELSPAVLYHAGLIPALKWLAAQMKEQFGLQVELEVINGPQFESVPLKVFIFRAAQELLFNVVKHAGVKNALLALSGCDGRATMTVSDQGRGFDPDILKPSTSRVGLGLLSIRERASYIGGSLEIESAPGKGNRFILTIPLGLSAAGEMDLVAGQANCQRQIPAEETTSGSGVRVLFADDHKVMRQGLIRLIAGQPGIQIVGEASNGREAIELARQLRPDVIVMDISMPEVDGIEATRRIKSCQPEIRVIGLSMSEDEHTSALIRAAGADAFVSKAASSAELLKAIYGIIGGLSN